jgi:hypothetical protein
LCRKELGKLLLSKLSDCTKIYLKDYENTGLAFDDITSTCTDRRPNEEEEEPSPKFLNMRLIRNNGTMNKAVEIKGCKLSTHISPRGECLLRIARKHMLSYYVPSIDQLFGIQDGYSRKGDVFCIDIIQRCHDVAANGASHVQEDVIEKMGNNDNFITISLDLPAGEYTIQNLKIKTYLEGRNEWIDMTDIRHMSLEENTDCCKLRFHMQLLAAGTNLSSFQETTNSITFAVFLSDDNYISKWSLTTSRSGWNDCDLCVILSVNCSAMEDEFKIQISHKGCCLISPLLPIFSHLIRVQFTPGDLVFELKKYGFHFRSPTATATISTREGIISSTQDLVTIEKLLYADLSLLAILFNIYSTNDESCICEVKEHSNLCSRQSSTVLSNYLAVRNIRHLSHHHHQQQQQQQQAQEVSNSESLLKNHHQNNKICGNILWSSITKLKHQEFNIEIYDETKYHLFPLFCFARDTDFNQFSSIIRSTHLSPLLLNNAKELLNLIRPLEYRLASILQTTSKT